MLVEAGSKLSEFQQPLGSVQMPQSQKKNQNLTIPGFINQQCGTAQEIQIRD